MAYNRQQQCDTYFVESQESFPAASNQDYAKMLGRRRQEAIGDVLSRQAYEAYVEDIVDHMKQVEVNSPATSFIPCALLTFNRTRP
jgi:hypothetical protein